MIRIFLDLFVIPISRLYSVIISDARDPRIILPAKLIHKSNEVIGRNLEFGIGTMAREHDGDTGRKQETMMTKEDVEMEEDRKKKKKEKRTEQQKREEKGRGSTWVQRC